MDEHWDGGYPEGLRREQIPLTARIIGLTQVAEVYWGLGGPGAALDMARERRGRWFDPELVRVLGDISASGRVWSDLETETLSDAIATAEPVEQVIPADESRLDRIAHAFALVVDAQVHLNCCVRTRPRFLTGCQYARAPGLLAKVLAPS